MKNLFKNLFIFSILAIILFIPAFAFAQTAVSNCVVTKIGDAIGAPHLPATCPKSAPGGGIPGTDQAELLKQIKTFVDEGKISFEQSNDREGMTNGTGQVLRDDGTMITIDTQVLRFYVYIVGQGYTISVSSMVGHHDKYSSSGYISRHWDGYAIDIDGINGQDVINPAAHDVTIKFMQMLNGLVGQDIVPSQLLCAGNGSVNPEVDSLSMDKGQKAAGFTTKYVGDHTNHVHVGY